MIKQEIETIAEKLADIVRVPTDADHDDKAEIFRKLTYHPGRRLVKARRQSTDEAPISRLVLPLRRPLTTSPLRRSPSCR